MVRAMAGLFKLPPQEFAAKMGIMAAVIIQPLAMILLFILALKEDGAAVNAVFQALITLALGSGAVGLLASGVHAVSSALIAKWTPPSNPPA